MIYFRFNTLLICTEVEMEQGNTWAWVLDNQDSFKEWFGCFTQLPEFYSFGKTSHHHNGKPSVWPYCLGD